MRNRKETPKGRPKSHLTVLSRYFKRTFNDRLIIDITNEIANPKVLFFFNISYILEMFSVIIGANTHTFHHILDS